MNKNSISATASDRFKISYANGTVSTPLSASTVKSARAEAVVRCEQVGVGGTLLDSRLEAVGVISLQNGRWRVAAVAVRH